MSDYAFLNFKSKCTPAVFVSSHDDERFSLDLYDFNGVHIREISNGTKLLEGQVPPGKIFWPKGIAIHPSGDVLVVDDTKQISQFDPLTKTFKQFLVEVNLPESECPKADAICIYEGLIYVAGYTYRRAHFSTKYIAIPFVFMKSFD